MNVSAKNSTKGSPRAKREGFKATKLFGEATLPYLIGMKEK